MFLAVDGDNVGSRLEYFAITNNVVALKVFSATFNSSMVWFEKQLKESFNAEITFSGGDNLLARLNKDFPLESLEELRRQFFAKSESTLSMGMGETPQQAYLALKLAKTNGKNSIRQFQEIANEQNIVATGSK